MIRKMRYAEERMEQGKENVKEKGKESRMKGFLVNDLFLSSISATAVGVT